MTYKSEKMLEMNMQTPNTLPRKQRERLARREEILDAARTIFSSKGFEKAKLDEIAELAELGKGTIYNYFSSKGELFASVVMRGIKGFQTHVSDAVSLKTSPQEKIEAYIEAAFSFFSTHRQLFSIFELERYNLARSLNDETFDAFCEKEVGLTQYLEQLFYEGVRSGDFKPFDAQKMARTTFGAIHIAMTQAARENVHFNIRQETDFIRDFVFEGVLNS